MPRIPSHITETKSRLIFEKAVTEFQCGQLGLACSDAVFRQITERDYGIDGLVDLLSCGEPTGRTAYIQLKGTEKVIEKLKRSEEVSCSGVTRSNLLYCRQNNIPVMLVYVSTADGIFYYLDLQSVYKEKLEEIEDGKTVTVRIPVQNNSEELKRFFEIINHYYDEKGVHKSEPSRQTMEAVAEKIASVCTGDDTCIVTYPVIPLNGECEQINSRGDLAATGLWKDGRLEKGIEYDWLIQVTGGKLVYKPDCPDDPYDATEDFAYGKFEQYASGSINPFSLSRPYLERGMLNQFYVVDLEIDGDMEQIINIRSLLDFLQRRDPKLLCDLREQEGVFSP